jgi:hypothetical protein
MAASPASAYASWWPVAPRSVNALGIPLNNLGKDAVMTSSRMHQHGRLGAALALAACVLSLLHLQVAAASAEARPATDTAALLALAREFVAREEARRTPAYHALLAALRADPNGPLAELLAHPGVELMGIDARGRPLINSVFNLNSAITINTASLWPGGTSGYNLTGANDVGELAAWEQDLPLRTHQELVGRSHWAEAVGAATEHATHVCGTMIAAGVDPAAHGMSPAAHVVSYNWNDAEAEMATAAAEGLLISNHSYGYMAGWLPGYSAWYWCGDIEVDSLEDAGFGIYLEYSAEWDEIAYHAPYYLIVSAAGNLRGLGPEPGTWHWMYIGGQMVWSNMVHDINGGETGHDTLPYCSTTKNTLIVGAVEDVLVYVDPSSVVMSDFSGWGPTDDGRIKPDLVTNGVGVYSCVALGPDAYDSLTGTSCATPAATGSANLAVQFYEETHGETPLASTLKAILLHTTREAGPAPGPDYAFGWGLMNTNAAIDLIAADAATRDRIAEGLLSPGAVDVRRYDLGEAGPVTVTIVWTDPPGTPAPWSLDPPELKLVHDLDLRLEGVTVPEVYYPYVLDPADPFAAATTGDNFRDNVEKIYVEWAPAGEYRVTVGHKGELAQAQPYSLVQTGLTAAFSSAGGEELAASAVRWLPPGTNPFSDQARLRYELSAPATVSVRIYDITGRLARTLLERGAVGSGVHSLAWDGADDAGRHLPAGVYLCRLDVGASEVRSAGDPAAALESGRLLAWPSWGTAGPTGCQVAAQRVILVR